MNGERERRHSVTRKLSRHNEIVYAGGDGGGIGDRERRVIQWQAESWREQQLMRDAKNERNFTRFSVELAACAVRAYDLVLDCSFLSCSMCVRSMPLPINQCQRRNSALARTHTLMDSFVCKNAKMRRWNLTPFLRCVSCRCGGSGSIERETEGMKNQCARCVMRECDFIHLQMRPNWMTMGELCGRRRQRMNIRICQLLGQLVIRYRLFVSRILLWINAHANPVSVCVCVRPAIYRSNVLLSPNGRKEPAMHPICPFILILMILPFHWTPLIRASSHRHRFVII